MVLTIRVAEEREAAAPVGPAMAVVGEAFRDGLAGLIGCKRREENAVAAQVNVKPRDHRPDFETSSGKYLSKGRTAAL